MRAWLSDIAALICLCALIAVFFGWTVVFQPPAENVSKPFHATKMQSHGE